MEHPLAVEEGHPTAYLMGDHRTVRTRQCTVGLRNLRTREQWGRRALPNDAEHCRVCILLLDPFRFALRVLPPVHEQQCG